MSEIEQYYQNLMIKTADIVIVGLVIALLVGLWKKAHLHHPLKYFYFFLVFELVTQLLLKYFTWSTTAHYETWKPFLTYFGITDTLFFYWFSYLNRFSLFLYFFYKIIKNDNLGKAVLYGGWALAIVILVKSIVMNEMKIFSTFNQASVSLLSLLLAALYIFQSVGKDLSISLAKHSYFWISLGIFLLSSINFLLDLTGELLYEKEVALFFKISVFQNFVYFSCYLVMGYGLYLCDHLKKNEDH